MRKLNITKERYEKSRYFNKKYGKLEYVSESGDVYKTDKGKVLKFIKENNGIYEANAIDDRVMGAVKNALNNAQDCFADELEKQGFRGYDGDSGGGFYFNDRRNKKTYYVRIDIADPQKCEDYEG